MNETEVERATQLVNSLLAKIKAPPKAIRDILTDTDWAFVIKLHSMIEAALNHLLLAHFGDPRLVDFFVHLEVGRLKTGKLALVKSLDLLPNEAQSFIKWLSEARNQTAHRIEKLDFDLAQYIFAMSEKAYENLVGQISAMLPFSEIPKLMAINPRLTVYAAVCAILCEIAVYATAHEESRNPEDYSSDELGESTPKGS